MEYYDGWYYDFNGERCTNCSDIRGTLRFTDITNSEKDVCVNMDALPKSSGYLTMGDNPITNTEFDQTSYITDHLVSMDDIKSVPIMEIPWFGILNILLKNSGENLECVPNSVSC